MSAGVLAWPAAGPRPTLSAACLGAVLLAHVAVLALLPAGPQPMPPPPRVVVTLLAPAAPAPPAPALALPQPSPPVVTKPKPRATEVRPAPAPKPVPPAPARSAPADASIEPPPAAMVPESSGPAAPGPAETPSAAAPAGTAPAGSTEPAAPSAAPIVPPRYDAAYLDNPKPEYPRLARRLGEQGTVLLNVYVNVNGAPEKILLHRSSGSPRLDQAARETVTRWKFVPARQGGQAVGGWIVVPITFVLQG